MKTYADEQIAEVVRAISHAEKTLGLCCYDTLADECKSAIAILTTPQSDCAIYPQQAQTVLCELYQVLGELGAPENVLANCLAAAEGRPIPHQTLLPFALEAKPKGMRSAEEWYKEFCNNIAQIEHETKFDLEPEAFTKLIQRIQNNALDAAKNAVEFLGSGSIEMRMKAMERIEKLKGVKNEQDV